MLKRRTIATTLSLVLVSTTMLNAQSPTDLQERVHSLVLAHHAHGIEYLEANALGPEAIPILLGVLGDESLAEYWVNTVVTLGFIEDSKALEPLIEFLYSKEGEVDAHTFRALSAVPFAAGCIASSGDPDALAFLEEGLDGRLQPGWGFLSKDISQLLAGKSIIGLAVSGQPRGRAALERFEHNDLTRRAAPGIDGYLDTGKKLMARLEVEPRAAIFNPRYGSSKGDQR